MLEQAARIEVTQVLHEAATRKNDVEHSSSLSTLTPS
jgi:hypothetical protein